MLGTLAEARPPDLLLLWRRCQLSQQAPTRCWLAHARGSNRRCVGNPVDPRRE